MIGEDTIKGRIRLFLKVMNITEEEFSVKTGLAISYLKKRKTSANALPLLKIAEAYPKLNILWVLGLRTNMLYNETEISESDLRNEIEVLKTQVDELKTLTIKQEGMIEIYKQFLNLPSIVGGCGQAGLNINNQNEKKNEKKKPRKKREDV